MTHQKTFRVIGFSIFFIGMCLAVVTLGVSADESPLLQFDTLAANPTPSPTPSPTPEIPHTLVGSYYTVENGISARLMLNNKGIEPLEVQPKIRNLNGLTLEIAPVFVEPRSFRFIDLQDWVDMGGESFSSGSVELFHTGRDLVLGAQIYLTDAERSLSFEEKLGEMGKFDSRKQERSGISQPIK